MAPHTPVRMLVVDNEPGVAGGLVPSPAQARRDRMARSQQLWSTGQELRRKSARLIAEVQTLRATSRPSENERITSGKLIR